MFIYLTGWSPTKNQVNYQITPQILLKEPLNVLDWFVEVQLRSYLLEHKWFKVNLVIEKYTTVLVTIQESYNYEAPFTIYRQIKLTKESIINSNCYYLCILWKELL